MSISENVNTISTAMMIIVSIIAAPSLFFFLPDLIIIKQYLVNIVTALFYCHFDKKYTSKQYILSIPVTDTS